MNPLNFSSFFFSLKSANRVFAVLFLSLLVGTGSYGQKQIMDVNQLSWPIYEDYTFDDEETGWSSMDHEFVLAYLEDGKYVYKNRHPNYEWRLFNDLGIGMFENFYCQMVFEKVEGPDALHNGILFNFSSTVAGDEYLFEFNSYGYFRVYRRTDGFQENVKEPTFSEHIRPGKKNSMGILSKGSKMYFYINNNLVYEMKKPPHYGSHFGFSAARTTTLKIDRFTIWYKPRPFSEIDYTDRDYELKKLGPGINTTDSENFPVLSPDGKMMFFSRSTNIGSIGVDQRTLMVSELNERTGEWGNAKPLPTNLNSGDVPQIICVSPDKNTLYLNGQYENGVMVEDWGLALSHRTKTGWSDPENQVINDFENLNEYESYSFSTNNKIGIISIQKSNGYGDRDLYVIFKNEKGWSTPLNLGPTINTYGDDSSPCLAPDNVTLYYSTSGKSGYGRSDVYVTRRLDNTWMKWSEPLNLGPYVNDKEGNSDFVVDAFGNYAFITRHVEVSQKSDIYKFIVPEAARPEPVTIINGKVLNKENGKPLAAEISYLNLDNGREEGIAKSNPLDGSFVLILPRGIDYSFLAEAKGYLSESQHINNRENEQDQTVEIDVDLYLSPVKVGEIVTLNSIFFEPQKYQLLPKSYLELDRVTDFLVQNPFVQIEIGGHTDMATPSTPDQELKDLSLNRAKSVKDYLVQNSIPPNRISIFGYGRTQPASRNQALNRRVEIKITRVN